MPIVRESITTLDCFSRAVNVPVGVGCLGFPIDAGICRATTSSMLTVKVCASMSATPTTFEPVSKFVAKPPPVTEIGEWAGQKVSGFHSKTWLLRQLNFPVGVLFDEMVIDCSAAARSLTGSANVTSIGAATPTTSPVAGVMLETERSAFGPGTAAIPAAVELTVATAVTPTTTSTYRTALRNASIPSACQPAKFILETPAVGGPATSRNSTSGGVLCSMMNGGIVG